MKFSPLVKRISGEGADAWLTHYAALAARDRGEDVIILSVGDPDLETPPAVVAKAIERLQAGDTHYCPAAGRRDHLVRPNVSNISGHPPSIRCADGPSTHERSFPT